MALIECLDCRAKVSDKAASCPKCGRSEQTVASLLMAGLFLAYNAVMAVAFVADLSVVVRGGGVTQAWPIGSVILGMLVLVTRRRQAADRDVARSKAKARAAADARRESETDDRQGGRE